MHEPAQHAKDAEENPRLPPGDWERVSGYGVMGLPFRSGHVLGLRRWTASSIGEGFTSIWHREPGGRWTFYESAPCDVACTRYFGDGVDRVRTGPIGLQWDGQRRLRVYTLDSPDVDWTIDIGGTLTTRVLSAVSSAVPEAAWHSRPVLSVMGYIAGHALSAGKVQLTGMTTNRQRFDANPRRIWYVTGSEATVEGQQLGPVGPLTQQAHLADFYIPQRGIFAVGRVHVRAV